MINAKLTSFGDFGVFAVVPSQSDSYIPRAFVV
jgi:hypothetical protein